MRITSVDAIPKKGRARWSNVLDWNWEAASIPGHQPRYFSIIALYFIAELPLMRESDASDARFTLIHQLMKRY